MVSQLENNQNEDGSINIPAGSAFLFGWISKIEQKSKMVQLKQSRRF